MRDNDHDDIYSPSRREALTTLAVSGLTLAVLAVAGYLTPDLLAILAR